METISLSLFQHKSSVMVFIYDTYKAATLCWPYPKTLPDRTMQIPQRTPGLQCSTKTTQLTAICQ